MLHRFLVCGLLAAVLSLWACTPKQHAQQADKAAYSAIDQKQRVMLDAPRRDAFSIEYRAGATSQPAFDGRPIPMGDVEPRVLSLDDALAIAFTHSRDFQTHKETLYAAALSLANARHQWSLLGGALNADASHNAVGTTSPNHAGTTEQGMQFAQHFANGGAAALGMGVNFAGDLLNMSSLTGGSLGSATLSQPLIRGAWRGFAYEALYRQERDLAIAVLDYERFTQSFSVETAAKYLQVLQQLDALNNEREGIKRLEQTFRTTRALVEGGQVSHIEQDQAEQNLLRAKVRLTQDTQGYEDALDNFKLYLGLPIQCSIALNVDELRKLEAAGLQPVDLAEPEAVDIALHARPDVLTQQASLRDAARNVEMAIDSFNPAVNLNGGLGLPSQPPRQVFSPQFDQHTRNLGLGVDYSFDQTNNRDAYRLAVIAEAKAGRDFDEFLDRVRLDVRQSYRQLTQARESYELQRRGLDVARRRRKLSAEQQKVGEASARDVLEAEDAYREALDGVTSAVVTYETTRIRFLAALGMLSVDERGKYAQRSQPYRFDQFESIYRPARNTEMTSTTAPATTQMARDAEAVHGGSNVQTR